MIVAPRERHALERVESLVRGLAGALTTRRVYSADHGRALEALESFTRELRRFVDEAGKAGGLRFTVSRGNCLYQSIPLPESSALGQLSSKLEGHGAGGLSFGLGTTTRSVSQLLDWLEDAHADKGPRRFAGIEVLPPQTDGDSQTSANALKPEEGPQERLPEFRVPSRIYQSAARVLERALEDIRGDRDLDTKEILALSRWAAEFAFTSGSQLIAPSQHERGDTFTFHHSINVFLISTALLQPFARDLEELATYAQAALLHDVGKSRVPEEILCKRGRLTDPEFALMRHHPEYGAEILLSFREVDPLAVHVAYCHHMRDGGHGYPQQGASIVPGPVTAVIQVADMFEALTAPRPYKDGRSVREALRVILATPGMESRKPVIGHLLHWLTCSPPGSEVRLSSGERGIVLAARPEAPDRPLLKVIKGPDDQPVEIPYEIDLLEEREDRRVVEVVLKPTRDAKTREPWGGEKSGET